jgi:hypothetical protein
VIDANLDHVGIVVPRLEAALETLSLSLGVGWLPIFEGTLAMHQPGRGPRDVHLRVGSSVQYPRLEVIEAVPGSPLDGNEFRLHHIAFVAGNLASDSSRLVAGRCPIEICGIDVDGKMPKTFTYHVQNGLRFELLEQRSLH